MINTFEHDWLSRPGEHGITTINATRVGPGDFYETLEDYMPADILRTIKLPAIVTDPVTLEQRPLWHEHYTMEQMDRIRRKTERSGGWAASYMQRPKAIGVDTFDEETINAGCNSQLSNTEPLETGTPIAIGVDPNVGSGRTAVIAMAMWPDGSGMRVARLRCYDRMERYESILSAIDEACRTFTDQGHYVTDVVVEDNAFQKGFVQLEGFLDMRSRYGFNIRGHNTQATNKYDENLGVAAMATSMRQGQIQIPWADEGTTRAEMGELVGDLERWRPRQKGSRGHLRQDALMALWFVWLMWRQRRTAGFSEQRESINMGGLRWERMGRLFTPARK